MLKDSTALPALMVAIFRIGHVFPVQVAVPAAIRKMSVSIVSKDSSLLPLSNLLLLQLNLFSVLPVFPPAVIVWVLFQPVSVVSPTLHFKALNA
jgi:hypothetical protein